MIISVQSIIFDLDGTLLNTLGDLTASVNYALDKMGYPLRRTNEIRQRVGNGLNTLIKKSVPEETAAADTERTFGFFMEHYSSQMTVTTAPYDGINEMLDTLVSEDFRLGVVSNKSQDAAEPLCKHFFGKRFGVCIGHRSDMLKKPAPDSLLIAAQKLGTDRSKAIYIGDSAIDVETARNAGIPCIGVTWGFRDSNDFIFAKPDYTANTPDEIIDIIKKMNK